MYRCEECQRDFKTAQALAGHHQFKHGGKPAAGRAAEQVNQQLTKPELQQVVAAQASNAQQQEDMLVNGFQQLDEKFSKLSEVVDGLLNMPAEYAEHGHGQHHHAGTSGVVGARIMLAAQSFEADDSGLNRILAAGAKAGIPVNVMCSGKLPLVRELARRHPDTQMVVDHVGLVQPFEPPAPTEPFADLPNVVSLAAYDNVAIKISGACTLARRPFPYTDIWEPLGKVFDAFGFDRCMWGTDWTRAVRLLTYDQGVEAFRVTDQLSESERSALMGGTLQKIYNWSPDIGG